MEPHEAVFIRNLRDDNLLAYRDQLAEFLEAANYEVMARKLDVGHAAVAGADVAVGAPSVEPAASPAHAAAPEAPASVAAPEAPVSPMDRLIGVDNGAADERVRVLAEEAARREKAEADNMAALAQNVEYLFSNSARLTPAEGCFINAEVWRRLGLRVPTLTPEQEKAFAANLARNPHYRPLFVPMLTMKDMALIADRARTLPHGEEFVPKDVGNVLEVCRDTTAFGSYYEQMAKDPIAVVKDGRKELVLGYTIVEECDGQENRRPVSRQEFLEHMYAKGDIILNGRGEPWMVVTINVSEQPEFTTPQDYHYAGGVRPIHATLDTIFAKNIFTQVAHTERPDREVEFVQEAVYQAIRDSKTRELVAVHEMPVGSVGLQYDKYDEDGVQYVAAVFDPTREAGYICADVQNALAMPVPHRSAAARPNRLYS